MPSRREGFDDGASLLRPPLSHQAAAATRSRNNSITGAAAAGPAATTAATTNRSSPYLRSGPLTTGSTSSLNTILLRSTSGEALSDVVAAASGLQPVSAVDAPYLSTAEVHLGRMTLTAPDNMRRRKAEEREKRQKARKRKAARAEAASNALLSHSGPTPALNAPIYPAATVSASSSAARQRPMLTATRSTSNLHTLQTLETQRSRSPTRPTRPRSAQNATRSDTSPERRPASTTTVSNVPPASGQSRSQPVAEASGTLRTEQRRARRRGRPANERGTTPHGENQSRRSSEQAHDTTTGVRAEALRRATQRRRDIYADLSTMGLPGASDSEPDDAPPPFPSNATRPISPPAQPADGEEWTEEMRRRQEEYLTNRPPDSPPPAFLSGSEDSASAVRLSGSAARQTASSPEPSSDDEGAQHDVMSQERRLWEEDAVAGFSFEERVERERVRRQAKTPEAAKTDEEERSHSSVTLPNIDLGQMVMEARARRNQSHAADKPAQRSEPDLPSTSTATASSSLVAPPSAVVAPTGKKTTRKSEAHRRMVSAGQVSAAPSAVPIEPSASASTAHRNVAIGTEKGLVNSAGSMIDVRGKVTSIRPRPASESHSRFRDDASAAANRRLALWGPKLDDASGSGSASESLRSQLHSLTAPAPLRSRSTTDVADRLKSLLGDNNEAQGTASSALMRRRDTSSSSLADDDRESSDSDAAWEKEEKQFRRLQQASQGRPVVIDSSDDDNSDDDNEQGASGEDTESRMPGGFKSNVRAKRRAIAELPELGKVGSTIPRAPPPLALGRSRGGAAYSSSSESSSESETNRMRDDEDESGSDSPPDMDEVVSTGGDDGSARHDVLPSSGASFDAMGKGKKPMRPLPSVPFDSSTSSRDFRASSETNLHRAGTFQEDSGSSHDFSGDTDDNNDDDASFYARPTTVKDMAPDADASSRPAVQNRLKGLFAIQLSSSSSQAPVRSSSNASRASFEHFFDTPIDTQRNSGDGDERRESSAPLHRPSEVSGNDSDRLSSRPTDPADQRSVRDTPIGPPSLGPHRQPSARREPIAVVRDEQQARSEALQSLSQLQRSHDALPAGVDRDSLAALERLLARTAPAMRSSSNGAEPLTTEPSKLTRSGAIGSRQMASSAFVNPRTVNAPRPLGRLPTITDATRHFPPAQRPSPSPSSSSAMTAESSTGAMSGARSMLPTATRPMSHIGTPSWMAYIPTNERRALPDPMEPDRRANDMPPPRVPSPTRSITGSRVNAMVERFEQHGAGSGSAGVATAPRPPSPLKRMEDSAYHRPPVTAFRRRPPPPPSAWTPQRQTTINARELSTFAASTPISDSHRPSEGIYRAAHRPAQERNAMDADPVAAGDFYSARVTPTLPPRPRYDLAMQQAMHDTLYPPASPPPPSSEPIVIFDHLYSSEERSRSASNLFNSRPLPVPPRVDSAPMTDRVPAAMVRRPSTPQSFLVDEAVQAASDEDQARRPSTDDVSADRNQTAAVVSTSNLAATSSVDLPPMTALPPLQQRSPFSSAAATTDTTASGPAQPRRAPSLGYTDLDLFASRLADVRTAASQNDTDLAAAANDGDDDPRRDTYDDLHLLAEFLGPAKAPGLSQVQMETLPVGRVEVLRRRVVGKRDDGRDKVKLALAVTGVKVERCGVCLVQFKEGNLACVFPCLHVLHEQCAVKLLRNTKLCPICRAPVVAEA